VLAEWEAPPPPVDPDEEGLECDDAEDETPEDEDEPPPDEWVEGEEDIAECEPPPDEWSECEEDIPECDPAPAFMPLLELWLCSECTDGDEAESVRSG